MNDETLRMLWGMLTDEQLMKLKKDGKMDDRTKYSLLSEMYRRKMISFDDVAEPFL